MSEDFTAIIKTLSDSVALLGDVVKKDLTEIKQTTKENKALAEKTNGRVTRQEVKHEAEDEQRYPERISRLEQWKWKIVGIGLAGVFLITIGGYSAVSYGVTRVVRSELASYSIDLDKRITKAIKEELKTYDATLIQP